MLFTTGRPAEENLLREEIPRERIRFVRNVMIDTLLFCLASAVLSVSTLKTLNDSVWSSDDGQQYGLTLRNNTERHITVREGISTIVGQDREKIPVCVVDIMSSGGKSGRVPEHWDGKASERIAESIATGRHH